MPLNLKNLEYIKGLNVPGAPDFGTKLAELFDQVAQGVNNIEQQTNANATGSPQPPPPINSLYVRGENGHFQIGINHEGAPIYRGTRYFVAHSATPSMADPHIVDMGTSRNRNLFLGNTTRYFAAYAAYPGSAPGPMVFHGGEAQPLPVKGGGAVGPPPFIESQGSGTGTAGVAHSGFGPVPYRAQDGKPPIR